EEAGGAGLVHPVDVAAVDVDVGRRLVGGPGEQRLLSGEVLGGVRQLVLHRVARVGRERVDHAEDLVLLTQLHAGGLSGGGVGRVLLDDDRRHRAAGDAALLVHGGDVRLDDLGHVGAHGRCEARLLDGAQVVDDETDLDVLGGDALVRGCGGDGGGVVVV